MNVIALRTILLYLCPKLAMLTTCPGNHLDN